jgi:hypothetical protein
MLLRTLAVLALVLRGQTAVAQSRLLGPESLRGLTSLKLVVEGIPQAGAAGLDTASLRIQVEVELRRVGIVVADTALPFLCLNVNLIPTPDGYAYAYSYLLTLNDVVTLQRLPRGPHPIAVTWYDGGTGYAGREVVSTEVPRATRNLVQSFLNDYLAANPPRR